MNFSVTRAICKEIRPLAKFVRPSGKVHKPKHYRVLRAFPVETFAAQQEIDG
jgi:hypothetical protein